MDDMHAVVTNSTVDGVLAAFFAILIVIVILDAARICVKAIRVARAAADDRGARRASRSLRAPSGLFTTRRGARARAGAARDRRGRARSPACAGTCARSRARARYDRYVEHAPARAPGRAGDVAARLRAPPPGRARGPAAGALLLKLRARRRSRRSSASAGGSSAAADASLGYDELAGLSGLGEPVAVDEVTDVYVPLAELLALRVEARARALGGAGRRSSASRRTPCRS